MPTRIDGITGISCSSWENYLLLILKSQIGPVVSPFMKLLTFFFLQVSESCIFTVALLSRFLIWPFRCDARRITCFLFFSFNVERLKDLTISAPYLWFFWQLFNHPGRIVNYNTSSAATCRNVALILVRVRFQWMCDSASSVYFIQQLDGNVRWWGESVCNSLDSVLIWPCLGICAAPAVIQWRFLSLAK